MHVIGIRTIVMLRVAFLMALYRAHPREGHEQHFSLSSLAPLLSHCMSLLHAEVLFSDLILLFTKSSRDRRNEVMVSWPQGTYDKGNTSKQLWCSAEMKGNSYLAKTYKKNHCLKRCFFAHLAGVMQRTITNSAPPDQKPLHLQSVALL